jgi:hypothetical protein
LETDGHGVPATQTNPGAMTEDRYASARITKPGR